MRESVPATVLHAQEILQQGLQRLAEQQLAAFNSHFQSVLDSIAAARSRGSVKDIASQQLTLLQEIIRRVASSAHESLAIVAATRSELVELMKKSSKSSAKSAKPAKTARKTGKLAQLKATAKKAVARGKANARKAQVSAKKQVAAARSALKKATAKKPVAKKAAPKVAAKPVAKKAAPKKAAAKPAPKKAAPKAEAPKPVAPPKAAPKPSAMAKAREQVSKTAAAARNRVAEAAEKVVSAITPSPQSRAFLATSQGKKEASVAPAEPDAGETQANANNVESHQPNPLP